MHYGVPKFVSNKTIRIFPSPIIPLLSFHQIINLRLDHKRADHTHLMTHNALMPTFPTSVPLFKVTLDTLAVPQICKVKEDDNVLSLWFGIFPWKGANENKLLRGRVRDGGEQSSADLNGKIVFVPVE